MNSLTSVEGDSTSQPRSGVGIDDGTVQAQRCHDLDVWQREVLRAGDLSLKRAGGRTAVGSTTVKCVLQALRTYMDGPGKPHPGANARPGPEELAVLCDITPRLVEWALTAGVHHGYLVRTGRGRAGRRATFAAALPVSKTQAEGPKGVSSTRAQGVSKTQAEGVSRTHPTSALPPHHLPPGAHPAIQSPIVAAVRGGRVDDVESSGHGLLRTLAGALPHPHGSDLLSDPRAGQVARRLVAIADVVPERELVEVLVAQLPQRVDSIAGLLLTAPRLPRLEERARARRLERAGRAERDDVAQAEALTADATEQAEAAAAARDLAAIKALPPNERVELERVARQHPMLRGRDRPPPALLRAELLNAYRRTRRASA